MMKTLCKLALVVVLAVSCHAEPVTEPPPADPNVARMLSILNDRLEPAQRDRVLKLWSDTRDRPAEREKLIAGLEKFEKKMQPDWTGLTIGGTTVALASGIGAGVLAAKLGAAGMVAGPIGAVAGIATGALVGYAIHKYHQRKAFAGGVFSRTGRHLGFSGRGLEGDLLKLEKELAKPPVVAPVAPAAGAPAVKKHWYDRFRRARPSPAAAAPRAPVAPTANGAARDDDLNMDDVNVSMRP